MVLCHQRSVHDCRDQFAVIAALYIDVALHDTEARDTVLLIAGGILRIRILSLGTLRILSVADIARPAGMETADFADMKSADTVDLRVLRRILLA